MRNLLIRVSIRLADKIRTNQKIAENITQFLLSCCSVFPDSYIKLKIYDFFLRFNFQDKRSLSVLYKAINLSRKFCHRLIQSINNHGTIIRSIIVKKYISPAEKGVLIVSFESELMKLAALPSLEKVQKKYHIVFLPSWQPFYSMAFYLYLSKTKEPLWIMPSSARDKELCATLGSIVQPLPFQASSWVNADFYKHDNVKKNIDVIMIANFSSYKRHWKLFEILKDLPPCSKVVIAGRPLQRRTEEVLLKEAEAFGARDRFELVKNPSDEMLLDYLFRAKLFCAMSHKEGSYIAIAEALLAGTPVGMFEDAIIGSKDYINSNTGILFTNKEPLSRQIVNFLQKAGRLDPSEWARENISAQVNGDKLNDIMKQICLAKGGEWTTDLAGFYCKNFNFHYSDPDNINIFSGEYIALEYSVGLKIEQPSHIGQGIIL